MPGAAAPGKYPVNMSGLLVTILLTCSLECVFDCMDACAAFSFSFHFLSTLYFVYDTIIINNSDHRFLRILSINPICLTNACLYVLL